MAKDECLRMEAEISALLDGELAAPEAAAVEAHLRACQDCAVVARDVAAASRALRAWDSAEPPAAVPAAFRSRVLAAVATDRLSSRARPARAAQSSAPPPRRLAFLMPVAAAAGVALVLGGLGFLLGATLSRGPVPVQGPDVAGPLLQGPLTAREYLALAERHGREGRGDLERREVLAAWGLSPEDPAVREALDRSLGIRSAALGAAPEHATAAHPASDAALADGAASVSEEGSGSGLWVGTWHFESPGAYDTFREFQERSREMEVAQAAREAARGRETATVASARPVPPAPGPLSRALGSLVVGSPSGGGGSASYQGLTVFPLRAAGGVPPAPGESPLGLSEGLADQRVTIADTRGKSATTVLVTNLDTERPLLVLAGDVLDGGRADRMAARDVLVPAGARNVAVPVYDVEAGRGSDHPFGTRFREVPGMAGARLRGLALGQASAEEVQAFVRTRLDVLDVTALHRSLADAFSNRKAAPVLRRVRPEVADLLRSLQAPDVVGFAVAHGRDLLAVEVFGNHDILAKEAGRLLEGCALEASTFPGGGLPPTVSAVQAMIEAAARGSAFRGTEGEFPEVGVVALEGGLLGSGVARGDAVLHACVLRGAGSGAIAGRGAKTGDLPGGGATGGSSSGSGRDAGTPGGAGGDGSPPDTSGGDGGKPADGPPTDERPR
jgi:hypothetical protein